MTLYVKVGLYIQLLYGKPMNGFWVGNGVIGLKVKGLALGFSGFVDIVVLV